MASSVVWYYREVARRVGLPRMKDYVTRFGYGNQDLSGVFAGIIEGKGASGRVARPLVERALAELHVLPGPSAASP